MRVNRANHVRAIVVGGQTRAQNFIQILGNASVSDGERARELERKKGEKESKSRGEKSYHWY